MNQNTKVALYLGENCHKNCSNSILLGAVDMCALFLGMHYTLFSIPFLTCLSMEPINKGGILQL